MAKRNTVNVDIEKILELNAEHGWSAATLARRVGKHDRWISEVKRGKNLPIHSEVAKMCLLLDAPPEDILTEQADVDLVNSLIEQEREAQIKSSPPEDEERSVFDDLDEEIISRLVQLTPEEWQKVDAYVQGLLAQR